jgi:hypothetical protein
LKWRLREEVLLLHRGFGRDPSLLTARGFVAQLSNRSEPRPIPADEASVAEVVDRLSQIRPFQLLRVDVLLHQQALLRVGLLFALAVFNELGALDILDLLVKRLEIMLRIVPVLVEECNLIAAAHNRLLRVEQGLIAPVAHLLWGWLLHCHVLAFVTKSIWLLQLLLLRRSMVLVFGIVGVILVAHPFLLHSFEAVEVLGPIHVVLAVLVLHDLVHRVL